MTFDLKVLVSYSTSDYYRTVELLNLKNDSSLYKWNLSDSVNDYDRVVNPMMLPNNDLVYSINMRTGLRRVDSLCNIKWKQDSIIVHHAFNLDSAGNIWTCSSNKKYFASGMYKIGGRSVFYVDDNISKIDINTGELLFHKSISEILNDNNLSSYLLKSPNITDPIHLNDVQPALHTTKFYKEGDLFLSIKQTSMVLHYRPLTNKIIRIITGPFSAQHDVDFIPIQY